MTRKAAAKAPPTAPEPESAAQLRHYTAEEAVEEFHLPIKARTLKEWAYAREIPFNRMGKRITFLPADIRVVQAKFAVAPLDEAHQAQAAG